MLTKDMQIMEEKTYRKNRAYEIKSRIESYSKSIQEMFRPTISTTKREQIEILKSKIVNKRVENKTRNSAERHSTLSADKTVSYFIILSRSASRLII